MSRRRGSGGFSYYDFGYFQPSTPRKAKGGIKAQSKRGAFGTRWWSRRWVEVLEGFHIAARLARGRTYARQGQVTDIRIGEGRVTAQVQGSRPAPYTVTIKVRTLSAAQWKKVGGILAREALHAAKLLGGEIPEDIESAFAEAGHTLFPSTVRDLVTDCSCPDWSNPCKHIAAVYYLLGEEFDRDPFLIFQLRGMSRSGLLDLLHERAGGKRARTSPRTGERAAASAKDASGDASGAGPGGPAADALPLPPDPEAFWGGPMARGPAPGPDALLLPSAAGGATLARRLGSFPFWRGREAFLEALDRTVGLAASEGRRVLASLAEGSEERTRPGSTRDLGRFRP